MFSDNPILSRMFAITLLIAVIAGIWLGLAAPIIDQRSTQQAEIKRAIRLINGFEARHEDIGALKRQLAALHDDPALVGTYFTARNPTLAAAKLQSRIKTLTLAAGGRLTSTQVVTAAAGEKGPKRITIKATMVGSVEAIQSVFHTLESVKPFVFLNDISITTSSKRRRTRRRQTKPKAEGLLTVRFRAYGFLWHGGKT
ncbi:MAG: general secretion pathway protein M [Alphaproteobacteria bacterium]|jgi:general secretion pathway protein M